MDATISPVEYIELFQILVDLTSTHFMNSIAMISAYIIAIYFVGQKLSKQQFLAV